SRASIDALHTAAAQDHVPRARGADVLARRPERVYGRRRVHPDQLRAGPRGRPRPRRLARWAPPGWRHRFGPLFEPPPRVLRGLQRDLQLAGAGRCGAGGSGWKRVPRRVFEANHTLKKPAAVLRKGNERPDFVTMPWVL